MKQEGRLLKILLLNAGNETGGGMRHLLDLAEALARRDSVSCVLGVLEKGKLYDQAQQLSVEVVHFQGGFPVGIPLFKQLKRFIISEKITHVHSHGPRANVIMRQLKRLVSVPWVTTIHSDPFIDFTDRGLYGRILTRLHVSAIRKADHLIAVSASHCRTLAACGIAPAKMTMIHNGFDFSTALTQSEELRMEIAQEISPPLRVEDIKLASHIGSEQLVIVQVARLEKVKGHEWMFKALHSLRKQWDMNVQLVLVGGGTQKQRLQELAGELGLADCVYFAGEREDVVSFYEIANLVALSSLSEGFPYVLLEAARFAKPVVATDVGDVGMLMNDAEFGWLVPPADNRALAQALAEAYQQHQTGSLAEKGVALQGYAKNHFSLDKCVEEVYNVYKRLTS